MELRKIFKSGNSLVISMGAESKMWLDLEPGDQIMLQNAPGPKIILTKVTKVLRNVLEHEEVVDG